MRLLHMSLGVLVAAVWGVNFVAAKYGMSHFPPFMLTCLRFTMVAAVLVPFVPVPKRDLKQIAALSLLLGAMHFGLLFSGMWHGLDIATTAIAGQLGVPFACLLGSYFHNDKLGKWRSMGMGLSFLGIAVVAGSPNVLAHWFGFLLVMLGAFCWGAANLFMKRLAHVPIMSLLGWMSLLAVPQLLVLSLLAEKDQWRILTTATPVALAGIAYSAFCSTVLAYGLWYWLLRRYPVTQVTPYSLLAPVFGVASGVMVFGDGLTPQVIAGGLLTIAGVAIIVVRRPRIGEGGGASA